MEASQLVVVLDLSAAGWARLGRQHGDPTGSEVCLLFALRLLLT